MKFYPYKKVGVEKVLAMLKGVGLSWKLEVLAILKGGAKSFQSLNEKFYSVLGGGAQTVSDPRFSHFVAPLPIINDQSLRSGISSIRLKSLGNRFL